MRILLDTHVFLWHITGDARLPETIRNALREPSNEVFLSAASVWEAVIKYSLGKLSLPASPAEYLPRQRAAHQITALAIDESVFVHLQNLPAIHRDPFDRILVAQALQHGLTIATVDAAIRAYSIPML